MNCKKAMININTNTYDMLVVAKNSTTDRSEFGMPGKAIHKDPDPIID